MLPILCSLPLTVRIGLIFALWTAVSEIRADFQNCDMWYETWLLVKVPEVAHAHFPPQGIEIELIFALWAAILRHGPILKIAIFGHETWLLVKFQKLDSILSFYPSGSKIEFILCSMGYGYRDSPISYLNWAN